MWSPRPDSHSVDLNQEPGPDFEAFLLLLLLLLLL